MSNHSSLLSSSAHSSGNVSDRCILHLKVSIGCLSLPDASELVQLGRQRPDLQLTQPKPKLPSGKKQNPRKFKSKAYDEFTWLAGCSCKEAPDPPVVSEGEAEEVADLPVAPAGGEAGEGAGEGDPPAPVGG